MEHGAPAGMMDADWRSRYFGFDDERQAYEIVSGIGVAPLPVGERWERLDDLPRMINHDDGFFVLFEGSRFIPRTVLKHMSSQELAWVGKITKWKGR